MGQAYSTDELQALQDFFDDLSESDKRKVFLSSFRRAGKVLIDTVRPQLPRRTGNLQNSLGIQAVSKEASVDIGAFRGGSKKGWHGHLIENGTVERFRKSRQNASTGRMRPDPIWEQSYNQTEQQMCDMIRDDWFDTIYEFGMKRFRRITR